MSILGALLAAVALAASSPHTVDLTTGRFDGHTVLGRSVAGVTAALGAPSFRGARVVGWGNPRRFSYEVLFRRIGGRLRAATIVLEDGDFRDPHVGSLLARSSADLRRAIASAYGFAKQRRYRCRNSVCTGILTAAGGDIHVTYGRTRARGTFVTIWRADS